MKITKKETIVSYTIELNWEELRDISNALNTALNERCLGINPNEYPKKQYEALQDTIRKIL